MSFLGTLFGHRTRLSASSSVPRLQMTLAGQNVARYLAATVGADVVAFQVANTNSMLPTFDENAILLGEKVSFDVLREGDIVTWRSAIEAPGKVIVHRLNEREGRGWWTLGDGNGSMDSELVTPENFDRRICGILYAAKDATTDQ